MAKELSDIMTRAAEVRDATLSAENTAERVGGVLCDLLEYLAGMIDAGDVQVVADSDGTGLRVTFRNAQGQAIARRLNLPVASASAGGLLSPELLTKLNAAYTQSGTNQTAIETRRLEIAELTERLKGRSQYSNAFTDPQVFLGDFDTIEEVNATIDGLVTQAASSETKYTGHCIVGLAGCRFDIHQYALHFATGDFVQCVCGCVKLNANANGLLQDGQYNIFFRRVRSFVPDEWKGIPSLIPYADELYYGLLDPRDKIKLNNVVDLEQITDMKYYVFAVCIVILSKDGSTINRLVHKDACFCRLTLKLTNKMKAINILRILLSESVNTENCGIVKVYENMPYTEFIRQYLCHDFQGQVLDYHRCVAIKGEYFYCWHSTKLNFCQLQARFGCNFCCYIHYIEGSYLHIIPITDEECEED